MKDFFISYAKTDQAWAEWIAWTLEEAGYSTVIQAWDFRPGTNFVLEIPAKFSLTKEGPYPIPVLADPKKIIQALGSQKLPSADAVNTTTGPQLPKYVSHAFGPLNNPGNPATSAAPTAPSVATSSNPRTSPTISFLATNSPNASLSVGQNYKDFYIR